MHARRTRRLTRSGRSPSFPALDRLGKVRWTRARDGPIGWRAALVLDRLGHVPGLPMAAEASATAPHQVRVAPRGWAAPVKKLRSGQSVRQRAVTDPRLVGAREVAGVSASARSANSAGPRCWTGAFYFAFSLREDALSYCTATYTPVATPSDRPADPPKSRLHRNRLRPSTSTGPVRSVSLAHCTRSAG